MIDYVSAIIPYVHEPLDGGTIIKVLPTGEEEWRTNCRLSVRGSHARDIHVRSQRINGETGLCEELFIDGNPSKFLQGHNIFGSNDLCALVYDTLLAVSSSLGFTFPDDTLAVIRAGEYSLTRVDVNYMYQLPSLRDVKSWLRAAQYKSKTRHGRPSSNQGSLVWGKGSKRWSMVAYSKGEEITAGGSHALPESLLGTPLPDFAQNKLRLELRLRTKELEKLNLREAKNWQGFDPYATYNDYLKRIEMNEQIALTTKVLDQLPRYLQGTYALWQSGHNLREMMPKNSFYRHRRALLEFGVDIDLMIERVDQSNVVPLVRVLEAMPVQIPDWAFNLGLVHPSAERVANHG